MACTNPLPAKREDGTIKVLKRGLEHTEANYLELPCGQCINCRIERAREWTIRCTNEAALHRENCFLTLTYSDQYLEDKERSGATRSSLDVEDWKRFMKRLRKSIAPKPLRYFHVGEYGEETARPHYHALLFGHEFAEDRYLSGMTNGYPYYRSASLEKLWPHGMTTLGHLTPETVAYVCKYVTKKITGEALEKPGPNGLRRYERVDKDTGEIWEVAPEYATMSRDPKIGLAWIQKHHAHTFPADFLIHNRQKAKPPSQYLDWLKQENESLHHTVKAKRINHLIQNPQDRTKKRRRTIAELTALKLKAAKRRSL